MGDTDEQAPDLSYLTLEQIVHRTVVTEQSNRDGRVPEATAEAGTAGVNSTARTGDDLDVSEANEASEPLVYEVLRSGKGSDDVGSNRHSTDATDAEPGNVFDGPKSISVSSSDPESTTAFSSNSPESGLDTTTADWSNESIEPGDGGPIDRRVDDGAARTVANRPGSATGQSNRKGRVPEATAEAGTAGVNSTARTGDDLDVSETNEASEPLVYEVLRSGKGSDDVGSNRHSTDVTDAEPGNVFDGPKLISVSSSDPESTTVFSSNSPESGLDTTTADRSNESIEPGDGGPIDRRADDGAARTVANRPGSATGTEPTSPNTDEFPSNTDRSSGGMTRTASDPSESGSNTPELTTRQLQPRNETPSETARATESAGSFSPIRTIEPPDSAATADRTSAETPGMFGAEPTSDRLATSEPPLTVRQSRESEHGHRSDDWPSQSNRGQSDRTRSIEPGKSVQDRGSPPESDGASDSSDPVQLLRSGGPRRNAFVDELYRALERKRAIERDRSGR
ncbi:hypothetical protein [Natrialbaceae archaeon AArc-T1-2]|uniref:hypothetical protein n=1 Tax=Natrialbaceae archaeon AArc-T1-2 TaxID=3053904 RepID=UPI00255ADCCD|nr:hypothetical protein [Natrialbaceae archaeon AArc-T1-2]WIV66068.1 hypothetical protein QQ977_10220 [Natrialbaceae archaeon AArc-T1-2]